MINRFPFNNYIYLSSKPVKNQGDSSVDSDSFKDLEEETERKNNILKIKNKCTIPNVTKRPFIKKPIKKFDIVYKKSLKLTPKTSTKYTEKGSIKSSTNDKESNFIIKNKIITKNENNRYNNCFDKIHKNNIQFLSVLKDEDSDFSEGIIDNEISVNFVEGFNLKSKKVLEKQVEIPLDNISRINTSSFISDYFENINRLIFSKSNNIKSIKESQEKKLQRKSNFDMNSDKYLLENKENYIPNKQYDKEVKINLNEINKIKNSNNIIYLDKSKSISTNSKNKINNHIDIKKSQKSLGSRIKNKQINSLFNLNKNYKIIHKFLCIGIDTTGLNSLDDEMNNFILNPKITYNYPFNNLENELE